MQLKVLELKDSIDFVYAEKEGYTEDNVSRELLQAFNDNEITSEELKNICMECGWF